MCCGLGSLLLHPPSLQRVPSLGPWPSVLTPALRVASCFGAQLSPKTSAPLHRSLGCGVPQSPSAWASQLCSHRLLHCFTWRCSVVLSSTSPRGICVARCGPLQPCSVLYLAPLLGSSASAGNSPSSSSVFFCQGMQPAPFPLWARHGFLAPGPISLRHPPEAAPLCSHLLHCCLVSLCLS